jgi:predicted transcriptional regulator
MAMLARTQLGPILQAELTDPKLAKLYEMTGEVTASDCAKKLSCSKSTVIESWKRWERLGILQKDGARYRKTLN